MALIDLVLHRLSVFNAFPIEDNEGSTGIDGDMQGGGSINHGQIVKKLVRVALACEHSRPPIRRADINPSGS